ncbi:MAG: hypothetical protein OXH64_09235 [Rhodospirillaceae bacterium]|nr:hypothetical protein [Rhodospirillaceae bacterium]
MPELLFDLPPLDRPQKERVAIARALRHGLYADIPGSGPAGERCAGCRHARRMERWAKCNLVRAQWTASRTTDIRLRTPACRKWQAEPKTEILKGEPS